MRRWDGFIGAFLAITAVSGLASAHLTLTTPPARHPASDLKYGPCGIGSPDQRSVDPAKITTYRIGETITVTWTEVVDHDPSHYRIAFSAHGDNFDDPSGFDDIRADYPILLDGIPDANAGPGHEYSAQVTLPDEPCDACTLQVIQVMHDKPPWGPAGGDDIYYQCADIVLTDNDDSTTPSPTGNAGASSTATGGATGVTNPPVATGGFENATNGEDSTDGTNPTQGCSWAHGGSNPLSREAEAFLALLLLLAWRRQTQAVKCELG